jgi:septum formation protein
MVRRLAVQKAVATAAKLKFRPSLVIGSDTVVFYKGKIYGKPMSPRHARVMLMKLSGKTHQVYTGVAVVNSMNLKVASAGYGQGNVQKD